MRYLTIVLLAVATLLLAPTTAFSGEAVVEVMEWWSVLSGVAG